MVKKKKNEKKIVAVRYSCQKILDFFPLKNVDLKNATTVVVETEIGEMLGQVVSHCCGKVREHKGGDGCKGKEGEKQKDTEEGKKPWRVVRVASAADKEAHEHNEELARENILFCKKRITARNLPMKLVNAEFSLDRSKIVFYFVADGRVDFRELVKDIAHKLHIRVELRQISSRSEAHAVGGIGVCGRELCCVNIGMSADRVSIKMAKEQGVAVNPEKISGHCGRLVCCLAYEFENYKKAKASMPPIGSVLPSEEGEGKVVGHNVITQEVTIKLEDGRLINMPLIKIKKRRRRDKKS